MYELEYRETIIQVTGEFYKGNDGDRVNPPVKDEFHIEDIVVETELMNFTVLTLIDTGDTLQEIEDLILDKYFS